MMSTVPRLTSTQPVLLWVLLLLLSQLANIGLTLDCCHGKETSVLCGAGISKFPEPASGNEPFRAPGYCGYNISQHYQPQTSLDRITDLELSGADFKEFPEEVLRYFPNLEKIYLSGNKLESIAERAFSFINTTSKLKELDLRKNAIKTINAGAFTGLGRLLKLHLEGNFLTSSSIPEDVFDPLQNLTELTIARNRLERIKTRWFLHLPKLEILDLEWNKITTLSQFPPTMSSIEDLLLGGNLISVIREETFAEMISLTKLVLKSNRIEKIEERAFEGCYGLHYINLANNSLREIPRSSFTCLIQLRVLVLNDNKLTTAYPEWLAVIFNNCDIYDPVPGGSDPHPESVMVGNPWICDENMDELAILLEKCVTYDTATKRCAKRNTFLCSGEAKEKYLQDVRNNATIASYKYEELNITNGTTCEPFLPTRAQCNPRPIFRSVALSKLKYGFLAAIGIIVLVTFFLSVKYFKGRLQRDKNDDGIYSLRSSSDFSIGPENYNSSSNRSNPDGESALGTYPAEISSVSTDNRSSEGEPGSNSVTVPKHPPPGSNSVTVPKHPPPGSNSVTVPKHPPTPPNCPDRVPRRHSLDVLTLMSDSGFNDIESGSHNVTDSLCSTWQSQDSDSGKKSCEESLLSFETENSRLRDESVTLPKFSWGGDETQPKLPVNNKPRRQNNYKPNTKGTSRGGANTGESRPSESMHHYETTLGRLSPPDTARDHLESGYTPMAPINTRGAGQSDHIYEDTSMRPIDSMGGRNCHCGIDKRRPRSQSVPSCVENPLALISPGRQPQNLPTEPQTCFRQHLPEPQLIPSVAYVGDPRRLHPPPANVTYQFNIKAEDLQTLLGGKSRRQKRNIFGKFFNLS